MQVVDDIIRQCAQGETEEERRRREVSAKMEELCVDPSVEILENESLLTIGGVNALSRGDLVSIKAKQKAGKSTMISILVAALLCGQWNKVRKQVDGHVRILYIDTEMTDRDTNLMFRKALRLAGLPFQKLDNVKYLNMRRYTSDQIHALLPEFIWVFSPDIVFIDGIVDLINDFNDVKESQAIVREMISLAEHYNCCIVMVLHMNKAMEDKNMRGHLGTILAQKSNLVFACEKDRDSNIVTVKCDDYRHAPVPDWSFGFDSEGFPICAEEQVAAKEAAVQAAKAKNKEEKAQKKEKERKDFLRSILKSAGTSGMVRSQLTEKFGAKAQLQKTASSNFITEMIHQGMLRSSGYNGNIILAENAV